MPPTHIRSDVTRSAGKAHAEGKTPAGGKAFSGGKGNLEEAIAVTRQAVEVMPEDSMKLAL